MQAKSVVRENALEDAALTFPALEGTVFLPGTVYGKAVRNSLTGKYEMGFCFLWHHRISYVLQRTRRGRESNLA
jgi:hypothetical protein